MSPTEGCCRSETKDHRRADMFGPVAEAILFRESDGSHVRGSSFSHEAG